MAEMNFGGVMETVVTSHEFSLEKAREVLKNETIAVIGYGIQGPGQACNLRDDDAHRAGHAGGEGQLLIRQRLQADRAGRLIDEGTHARGALHVVAADA